MHKYQAAGGDSVLVSRHRYVNYEDVGGTCCVLFEFDVYSALICMLCLSVFHANE